MTGMEQILSAALIAAGSGLIGSYFGNKGKVNENTCDERQTSCSKLLTEKIDNLIKIVDRLEKAVNSKLLGI